MTISELHQKQEVEFQETILLKEADITELKKQVEVI